MADDDKTATGRGAAAGKKKAKKKAAKKKAAKKKVAASAAPASTAAASTAAAPEPPRPPEPSPPPATYAQSVEDYDPRDEEPGMSGWLVMWGPLIIVGFLILVFMGEERETVPMASAPPAEETVTVPIIEPEVVDTALDVSPEKAASDLAEAFKAAGVPLEPRATAPAVAALEPKLPEELKDNPWAPAPGDAATAAPPPPPGYAPYPYAPYPPPGGYPPGYGWGPPQGYGPGVGYGAAPGTGYGYPPGYPPPGAGAYPGVPAYGAAPPPAYPPGAPPAPPPSR